RDGTTVATYGDVYGEWLEYDALPPVLVDAVIATEDRRFFDHAGFDMRGIARALLANLRAGHVVEGGSTITQQLAKNLFLSSERTIRRKLQEVMLAVWLEIRLSKQEILTVYLNRMYLGARSHGVDAAARTYFGHGARDLSVAQGAMLAGLLKAPSALSPFRDYILAMERSRVVIDAMVDAGLLTPADADAARATPPSIVRRGPALESRYFADWVVASLPPELRLVNTPLIVQTTLEPVVQTMTERALGRRLAEEGRERAISQGAVLVMSPDGAVRAMVGGRSYATSQFNRAVQARRQPGSAFKLYVYMAALDAGMTPGSRMRDSPIILDGWQPTNYDGEYRGVMTLRDAFAQSINTVAVKVSEQVNRRRVIEVARIMGVTSPITPHPSVALGTSDMTLMELTSGYAVIANGGYRVRPTGIMEVRSHTGEVLHRSDHAFPDRIVSGPAARALRNMLSHAVTAGTGRAAAFDRPAAGKTGTSQDFRDAWFVGFSGDYVTGVWVGNDNNTPMRGVTGGTTPARLWRDVMSGISRGLVIQPVGNPRLRPDHKANPERTPARNRDPVERERAPDEDGGVFDRLKETLGPLGR
ncbi:MAG: PBP1A family penicillin-binding protein, partial [Sphingomonadales bacterium]